ncbi:MAG: Lrp/AsnC family transcriptional regulator [Acutalibacteraceae bacterium]
MKKINETIVKLLEQDARYTAAEIAQMAGIPEEQAAEAIARLEKEGIICGYKALIDYDKFSSEHVTALIELKVTPQRDAGFEEMAQYIMKMDEVESVYLMSGAYDFCVTVQGKSFKDVALFVAKRLATMSGVVSTATHFVLRRYKELGSPMIGTSADDRRVLSF